MAQVTAEQALTHTLFDLEVLELPTVWSRARGIRGRHRVVSLIAWQELLRELAREEMSVLPGPFPYEGPLRVDITVSFPDKRTLEKGGDPDNVTKGIMDAFNKLVWKDDRWKYIRELHIVGRIAREGQMPSTRVVAVKL
jgi:Holliday junction resolvase RusA-like endonuclease